MKNINLNIKYALLLFVATTSMSCKKFLEEKPRNTVIDDAPINDKSSAETALKGVYNGLTQNGYYGITYQTIGYLSGDNLKFTGTVVSNNQFIQHAVRSDNTTLADSWAAIYDVINRANQVITKVPNVTDAKLTKAANDQLVGEAYFLRALAYFDLVRVWGGVPIVLNPTAVSTDNSGFGRKTADEVYAQVLRDLTAAEPLVALASTNRYRANKQTVRALRARYHLYRSEWALAEQYASFVIADAAYKLNAPYNSWFANGALATTESVFELSFNAANVTLVSAHRNSWQPTQNGGNKNWVPSDAFYALINDTLIGGNRKTVVGVIKTVTPNVIYGNLYYRNPAIDPAYVIRIAELYLIRAEARANQGNLSGALTDLNAVRKRAGLADKTAITTPTQDEVLQAIENERRFEFAFEPHRWFDLVRTNRAAAVLGVADPNKYVLPIPISQLQADPTLVQNPGY